MNKRSEIDREVVKGFGTLKIHKLGASKFWYARVHHDGKYHRKSLKVTDKKLAIEKAKEFYLEIQSNQSITNSKTIKRDFEVIASKLIQEEQVRVGRGELSKSKVKKDIWVLEKYFLPFFGKYNLKDINYPLLVEFEHNLTKDKSYSSNTLKRHFSFLKQIFNHGQKFGLITNPPVFPKFKTIDNPRSWFNKNEYQKLHTFIRNNIGKTFTIYKKNTKIKLREVHITEEIYDLVLFMTNTFIRPTDIKVLKHSHIQVITQPNVYLRLSPPETKRHTSPYVSLVKGVEVYQKIVKRQLQEGYGNDNDYVFFPKYNSKQGRTYVLDQLQRIFKCILEECGLYTNNYDETRSLYSLRHTAISFRLLESKDLDTLTLALNSRTSPEMIYRFYAKHLTSEMSVGKIQSQINPKLKMANEKLEKKIRREMEDDR